MADCKHITRLFDKALYNELTASELDKLNKHLEECENCSKEYNELKLTLNLVINRERENASPEFLDYLWESIEPEIEKSKTKESFVSMLLESLKPIFRFEPAWTKQLAVGLTILILGIFIGKSLVNENLKVDSAALTDTQVEELNNKIVQARANRYIDRSKVLLLGLINYDEKANTGIIDLQKQKEISQNLVAEAANLKKELSAPEQRRLKKLISDLEVVLLQIANLESEYDISGIDMVKEGVDKRGIFLKINIQKMMQNSSIQETGQDKEVEKNI